MAFKNSPSPHVHPNSLDSASTPDAFAKKEVELGTGTITCTDHGSLAACRTIYDLGHKNGLIPILGLEAYIRDDSCPILLANGVLRNDKGTLAEYCKYFHLTMHFQDQPAYNCAVKLLSKAPVERHGSESKPLFNWSDLEELASHNVSIGSGCLIGMVSRHLLDYQDPEMATRYFEKLLYTFGPQRMVMEVFPHVCDRNWVKGVFIKLNEGDKETVLKFYDDKKLKTDLGELTAEELARAWGRKDNPHTTLVGVKNRSKWDDRTPSPIINVERIEGFLINECNAWSPDGDVQKPCNEFILQLAKKYGLPVLVSDDSHMAVPEHKAVQDVRLMAGGGAWRFHTTYNRKTSQESFAYFNKHLNIGEKEFEGWVDNAFVWAETFRGFKFETKPSLPAKFFPQDTLAYTQELIQKHGRMRWDDRRYIDRLEQEIELFKNNGVLDLLPYFFNGERVAYEYQKNGLLTSPCRGSSGGVLLPYLMGITHTDPIKYELSLDRFMTLIRIQSGALPDIDMDFSNRSLLVGDDATPTITFEAMDGTVHTVPENTRVETAQGLVPLKEAFEQGIEFKEWWLNENR